METAVLSLVTGIVVGAVFHVLGFPVPAPNTMAGVLGVAGIFLGFKLAAYLLQHGI